MLSDDEINDAVARGRKRLDRRPVPRRDLAVGDRVWFEHDEGSWTVRAISSDGRWVICTQPAGKRYSVLDDEERETCSYTVLDFDDGVRGPDNYHGLGYETDEEIAAALQRFEDGDAEVSVRSDVYLDIVRHESSAS